MVEQGIVLGHKVSMKEIEVDLAKGHGHRQICTTQFI